MREQAIDDPFTAAPIKSRTCDRKPSGAIDIGEKVGLERISRSRSLKVLHESNLCLTQHPQSVLPYW
jgi:hypothetical protein